MLVNLISVFTLLRGNKIPDQWFEWKVLPEWWSDLLRHQPRPPPPTQECENHMHLTVNVRNDNTIHFYHTACMLRTETDSRCWQWSTITVYHQNYREWAFHTFNTSLERSFGSVMCSLIFFALSPNPVPPLTSLSRKPHESQVVAMITVSLKYGISSRQVKGPQGKMIWQSSNAKRIKLGHLYQDLKETLKRLTEHEQRNAHLPQKEGDSLIIL